MSFDRLLREPLLHFILLAALLFGLDHLLAQRGKTRIVVDEQTVDFLVRQREELELRTLSESERQETVASWVEEEILYQEAYRRGLDRGDSRMRRNLILKMRGLLTGDIDEPTAEQLERYYQDNLERFTRSLSLTLEQIYFSDPTLAPAGLPLALNADVVAGAAVEEFGESSLNYPRRMPGMTRQFLVGSFGAESARAIFEIADDGWHGPFESPRGMHFVRIVERVPARVASFEEVANYLKGDWLMMAARREVEAEVARIREDYQVIVSGDAQ